MKQFATQCLTTYEEFCTIRSEWDEFTGRCFPTNYSRTYPWLVAWWNTYYNQKRVNIYIQRNKEGNIRAAAPLYTKWENFSGLPVRMLQILGTGVGTDDFLISDVTKGFVGEVFQEIRNLNWHVARFSRITNESFLNELLESAKESWCKCTLSDTEDYFIHLPGSFNDYLQSRTRKFRRNLNQAVNRLNKMGCVEFSVLDPYKDAARVQDAGAEIARTSWQYKEGRSHFNERNSSTLYSNLAQCERGAGGEEFNLLSVDGNPVAYLLGCRRDRIYYAIDTAFHENFRSVSAGRILFGRIIERLINDQEIDILDFEGAGEYKDDYANGKTPIKSVILYNKSFYSLFIHSFKNSQLYSYLKKNISDGHMPVNGDEPIQSKE